ncbi:MAG: glycine cleavage T C-terminal barrel domain-containing protein [Pseudomonadota bacterium]
MIFPADDQLLEQPRPTPLYAACASFSEANVWTSVNGFAAARIFSSIKAEYDAARNGAAIADFGPLSRYAVRGPDAAVFLSRVASVPAGTLTSSESARGLMLDDDGHVLDLVEISRLSDDLFLMTTSSSQARRLQLAARGLDAVVENISRSVAAIAVLGPGAYEALAAAGLKTSGENSASSTVLRGVETAARPLQFGAVAGAELIFPADEALTVWERLLRRGKVTPIGLDAMEILRIESGAPRPGADFLVGPNTDQHKRSSPVAIGLPHLAPLDSGWFNGRRALRYGARKSETVLVVIAVDADVCQAGAAVRSGNKDIGRITSWAWSPSLKRAIAFASVPAGAAGKVDGWTVQAGPDGQAAASLMKTAEGALAAAFLADQHSSTESASIVR